jgi:hypothetical protein
MLGPIATEIKNLVDGVYRSQKYGRRFKTPIADLLAIIDKVDALEKEAAAKTKPADKPVIKLKESKE